MEQWLVIGISGVTCGGKTTLAQSLCKHFRSLLGREIKAGIELNRVEIINQDQYFRPVEYPNHQKIEKLNHINWEIIESLNMDKMVNDIMGKLGNKFILYNTRSSAIITTTKQENLFAHHFAGSHQMKPRNFHDTKDLINDDENYNFKIIKQNNVLNIMIIEGFLIFNHPVTLDLCNVKYHLHTPYEVCQARRSTRVYEPPDVLGYFEMIVWPYYEKHLRDFKDRNEITFLNGDVPPEKLFEFVLKSLSAEL